MVTEALADYLPVVRNKAVDMGSHGRSSDTWMRSIGQFPRKPGFKRGIWGDTEACVEIRMSQNQNPEPEPSQDMPEVESGYAKVEIHQESKLKPRARAKSG